MTSNLLRCFALIAAALVMGCAQEEGDVTNSVSPSVGANPAATPAPVEAATAGAPVFGEYRVLAAPSFEMRPLASWTREERGGFEVYSAPGGKLSVLVTPFGEKDDLVSRRDAALALVGGTEVRPAEQRSIRVGDAQLEAVAQDGGLSLPAGEAGFQCAVVNDRTGRKVFVAYVFTKDAPESMRADGMRMIGSLRDKSN